MFCMQAKATTAAVAAVRVSQNIYSCSAEREREKETDIERERERALSLHTN